MRIFLNERIIDFLNVVPGVVEPFCKIVRFDYGGDLVGNLNEFLSDERIVRLIVADSSMATNFPQMLLISETGKLQPFATGFDIFSKQFKYVSAAGGLVTNDQNQWLFIKRLGFWDLPKGKVDKQDYNGGGAFSAIQNAALREVREETSVSNLEIIKALPSTWHIYKKKDKLYLKQTFWFQMRTGGDCFLSPQLEEGIIEAKWVDFNNLKSYVDQSYRSLREFISQILL